MVVEDKLDGSLINLSCHNGEFLATTNRSINGIFGTHFLEYLERTVDTDQMESLKETLNGKTAVFEYIKPTLVSHVVGYDKEQAVLLTLIDNETGYDYKFNQTYHKFALDYGFSKPVFYSDVQSLVGAEQLMKELEHRDVEGVVVCINRGNGDVFRLKMKTNRYVELHKTTELLFNQNTQQSLFELYQLHMLAHQPISDKARKKYNIDDALLKQLNDFTKIDEMARIVEKVRVLK